jgi:hypothetical protein
MGWCPVHKAALLGLSPFRAKQKRKIEGAGRRLAVYETSICRRGSPRVRDCSREIGAQFRPDRRRILDVLTQADVEFGGVCRDSVWAAIELIVGRFHVRNHEAEHG